MTPELDKFINLATRYFEARPKDRDEAKSELMARLSHRSLPLDQIDVSGPTKRLEKAKQKPVWLLRTILLLLFLLGLGFGVFGAHHDITWFVRVQQAEMLKWRGYHPGAGLLHERDGYWENLLFSWVNDTAPDLPIGLDDGDAEIKLLYEQNPDDLAVLQEFLSRRSIKENQFMTAEQQALVNDLDPDNALWPLMEWRWLLNKAYGRDQNYNRYGGTSYSSVSDDQLALIDIAWDLYKRASTKGHLTNHATSLARRQLDAFPDERLVLEGMVVGNIASLSKEGSLDSYYIYSSNVASDLSNQLRIIQSGMNEEDFIDFFNQWLRVSKLRLESAASLLWYNGYYSIMEEAQMVYGIADSMGMEKEKAILKSFAPTAAGGHGHMGSYSYRRYGPMHRSSMENAGLRIGESEYIPSRLTESEIKTAVRAEMAFFDRMILWLGVLILIVFVMLCGFEASRRTFVVKGLARGLMPLLTIKDRCLIGMLGLLLPWAYWWLISRITPLGYGDFDFNDEWTVVAWLIQAALGLILGLVLMVHVVQWRWSVRGKFIDMRRGNNWLGWIVALVLALAIPAVGIMRHMHFVTDDDQGFFLAGCAAAGTVGLLWLLWIGGMNLFLPRAGALQANILSRTLRPWALAGLGSALLAALILFMAESYWYKADTLLPTWTSDTFVNAFEERALTEEQQRIKAFFDQMPD